MSKITKYSKTDNKMWRDMSLQEQYIERWNRKGQPKMVWPTGKLGTLDGNDLECQARAIKYFAQLQGLTKAQPQPASLKMEPEAEILEIS